MYYIIRNKMSSLKLCTDVNKSVVVLKIVLMMARNDQDILSYCPGIYIANIYQDPRERQNISITQPHLTSTLAVKVASTRSGGRSIKSASIEAPTQSAASTVSTTG